MDRWLSSTAARAGVLLTLACAATTTGQSPARDTPPPDDRLEMETRTIEGTDDGIRVGRMRVPEDRADDAGRMIHVDIVLLPATGPDPAADPIFAIAGGPGSAIAGQYRRYATSWMRERRDIVLVNQRGTGGDNRLSCDLPGRDDNLQGYLDAFFQVEPFRACAEELAKRADLGLYSTSIAMDDLDDVRVALGYERVNLIGGSYGTRAALVYMRRHPDSVRTAILNGVAPIAFTNPLYHAREAQAALELIFAECAGDPDCAAAYPRLAEEFDTVLRRLETEPAEVTVRHPATGAAVTVRLSRGAFAGALRIIMYYNSRDVPWLIHGAFEGDFTTFAQRGVESNRSIRLMLSFGMLLCVTCNEDIPRIDTTRIAAETDGTFLGDARVRAQIAVCEAWPKGVVPADYGDSVRSNAPTLLLSGTLDPVTPPRWGAEAARHLPNGLHLIVPGSHGVGGPCIDRIIAEFLDEGSTGDLDTTCTATMRLGGFRLPAEGGNAHPTDRPSSNRPEPDRRPGPGSLAPVGQQQDEVGEVDHAVAVHVAGQSRR